MSVEYKEKNDLPDLYNILGLTADVCKEKNCNEIIHKAYVKKAKVCHPDKHPGRKDVAEVFELITSAYNILREETKRNEYNHKLSLHKQSSNDFGKLKKGTDEYMKSIGQYVPPNNDQKLTFKEKMKEMDSKHGFDSSLMDAMSKKDAKKRLNEIAKTRAVQDIELKPERLFEDGRFVPKIFNEVFDRVHNRDDGAMVPHNGVPSAWNDVGGANNYSSFDNLDNLYVSDANRVDTGRQTFGGVDFGAPMRKITKEEVQNLKGADYVDGHNVLGDDYYKDMKAKLRERQSETTNYESMKYNDFKKDDTAGYGIFDQLGFKFDDKLQLDMDVDEDDISKKFEKIMAERQNDLLLGAPKSNGAQPPTYVSQSARKKKFNQSSR